MNGLVRSRPLQEVGAEQVKHCITAPSSAPQRITTAVVGPPSVANVFNEAPRRTVHGVNVRVSRFSQS
jgi:hypothetical protein